MVFLKPIKIMFFLIITGFAVVYAADDAAQEHRQLMQQVQAIARGEMAHNLVGRCNILSQYIKTYPSHSKVKLFDAHYFQYIVSLMSSWPHAEQELMPLIVRQTLERDYRTLFNTIKKFDGVSSTLTKYIPGYEDDLERIKAEHAQALHMSREAQADVDAYQAELAEERREHQEQQRRHRRFVNVAIRVGAGTTAAACCWLCYSCCSCLYESI